MVVIVLSERNERSLGYFVVHYISGGRKGRVDFSGTKPSEIPPKFNAWAKRNGYKIDRPPIFQTYEDFLENGYPKQGILS